MRGETFLHPGLGVSFTVPDGFIIDNSAAAVTATGPGDIAIRFDGVSIDKNRALTDYIRSGWVAGLDDSTVKQETINGNEAATAHVEDAGQIGVDNFFPLVAGDLVEHAEAGPHLDRSLQTIRNLGKKAGVSLNPATPETMIEYVLDRLDLILIMAPSPEPTAPSSAISASVSTRLMLNGRMASSCCR